MAYIYVLLMLLVFSVSPAVAEEEKAIDTSNAFSDHQELLAVSKRQAIYSEEVGFLFHKMTEKEPDFKAWAMASPRVQQAQIIDRNSVFIREYNRMKKHYAKFNHKDIVSVQIKGDLGDYSSIQSLLVLDQLNERTYFSYDVYGTNYALIPNGIERFHLMRLTPDEYRGMLELGGKDPDVRIEVLLKPVRADAEFPMSLNDKNHWLMLADIAEIRIWARDYGFGPTNGLLWFYRADWYTPEDDDGLMDLFEGGYVPN